MNITNKTVLITGGGSGIGFQVAKLLSENNNQVIITGRSEARLKEAAAGMSNTAYYAFDVNKEDEVNGLVNFITSTYPKLDVLINNAGQAFVFQLADAPAYSSATEEIQTNYLSVIRLTDKLLPILNAQQEAAIVNVTSVVAIAPAGDIPTYSASKAALRSYTQALRLSLKNSGSPVKVFELMPPLVNTDFSKDIGGSNGIPPQQVAEELLEALKSDTEEIHVGFTAQFYEAYLKSPDEAFKALNSRR